MSDVKTCDCVKTSSGHTQIHLTNGTQDACVDVGLHSLLGTLWHHQVHTVQSCEDQEGESLLLFASAADLERALLLFYSALRYSGNTDLLARAAMTRSPFSWYGPDGDEPERRIAFDEGANWRVHVTPKWWIRSSDPKPLSVRADQCVTYYLRFPAGDIAPLENALAEWKALGSPWWNASTPEQDASRPAFLPGW